MTTADHLDPVDAYGAAWLATDAAERLSLLERAWAPDGVYCDPLAHVTGRQALSDHIAGTQEQLAGGRVEVTSRPVRHHDSALFHWRITDAAGTTVLTGLDVVQVDDEGRIRRLTGFFDDAPAPS
ncbi:MULTISPECIES: nuclear transport factor 2 family protein [Geodermatophilus]|uniref:SnoaL-like domain-containing protein n=1 Tax=Geodermatophilus nigrescens TaxID=1070870 RepID=A0A1M5K1Z4_9ACTN|nr:nuclear transport factor 2 family protein [Geodermatophilus nigrescens]SHG46817.1 SnoaL-like domain-containing protein [Geodermatophilus nigrescens]